MAYCVAVSGYIRYPCVSLTDSVCFAVQCSVIVREVTPARLTGHVTRQLSRKFPVPHSTYHSRQRQLGEPAGQELGGWDSRARCGGSSLQQPPRVRAADDLQQLLLRAVIHHRPDGPLTNIRSAVPAAPPTTQQLFRDRPRSTRQTMTQLW